MRFAFCLLLVALLSAGCSEELSVEQQVIATIRNMEYAAEEGLHLEFMGYVADSFGAQHGSMDRREFHRFMIFQINQNRRLRAQLFPIFVKETGAGAASAQFRVLVTGGGGLLPENGQLFDVETQWRRDGGDWQLEQADWQAVNLPVL
ncbi:MAG: hypothetical protein KJO80_00330 [Gammaproteobacteria bacterium]|nr:hypothetical protein [Gammaproteobacteria bacterium]NNL00528.1 hypothetical protein [Xanthomonadales bacterium]